MKLRFLSLTMLLAMLVGHATAQCPDTKIKTIAGSVKPLGGQGCTVSSLTIGGFTVAAAAQQCPILVIDTPTHDIEEWAGPKANTQTRITNQVKEWTYFFRCDQAWVLIIPWGSKCVVDRTIVRNTLHRRTTISCPQLVSE